MSLQFVFASRRVALSPRLSPGSQIHNPYPSLCLSVSPSHRITIFPRVCLFIILCIDLYDILRVPVLLFCLPTMSDDCPSFCDSPVRSSFCPPPFLPARSHLLMISCHNRVETYVPHFISNYKFFFTVLRNSNSF